MKTPIRKQFEEAIKLLNEEEASECCLEIAGMMSIEFLNWYPSSRYTNTKQEGIWQDLERELPDIRTDELFALFKKEVYGEQ